MEDLVAEHACDSRTLASAYRHHANAHGLQPLRIKPPPLQPPPLSSSGMSPIPWKVPLPKQPTMMTDQLAQCRNDVTTMGESQRYHDHHRSTATPTSCGISTMIQPPPPPGPPPTQDKGTSVSPRLKTPLRGKTELHLLRDELSKINENVSAMRKDQQAMHKKLCQLSTIKQNMPTARSRQQDQAEHADIEATTMQVVMPTKPTPTSPNDTRVISL